MNACKRLRPSVLFSLLASLGAAACALPSDDAADANARVDAIVVVGTSVTSALYTTGELGLTLVPKDASGEAVLAKNLDVKVVLTSHPEIGVEVSSTACTAPEAGKQHISVGVILDDSGSMGSNDPDVLRKKATIGFLDTLGNDDKVLLTDYGHTGDDLRDLVCESTNQSGNASCSPPKAMFSADKPALARAAELISDGGGTPLYEACVQMVPLVDSVKQGRRGILLLSDGEPNGDEKRDACHAAAKAAQIPVFTVGLGPAAEGNPEVDDDAVKVLRELSTETGGSYASANDAAQLDQLFRNMGTALARGSCKTTTRITNASAIAPGSKIRGEVTVGSKGAKATFELVAPRASQR
ncbi:MAG: VWA domain-containing protein [Labilithrix sp.]|nr:VWA domain-containing protein [Labilithrix sp.]